MENTSVHFRKTWGMDKASWNWRMEICTRETSKTMSEVEQVYACSKVAHSSKETSRKISHMEWESYTLAKMKFSKEDSRKAQFQAARSRSCSKMEAITKETIVIIEDMAMESAGILTGSSTKDNGRPTRELVEERLSSWMDPNTKVSSSVIKPIEMVSTKIIITICSKLSMEKMRKDRITDVSSTWDFRTCAVFNSLMVITSSESSKMEDQMDKVWCSTSSRLNQQPPVWSLRLVNIKEVSEMEKEMDLERWYGVMVLASKDSGRTIWDPMEPW